MAYPLTLPLKRTLLSVAAYHRRGNNKSWVGVWIGHHLPATPPLPTPSTTTLLHAADIRLANFPKVGGPYLFLHLLLVDLGDGKYSKKKIRANTLPVGAT